jgi:hypothetical protein
MSVKNIAKATGVATTVGLALVGACAIISKLPNQVHEIALRMITSSPVIGAAIGLGVGLTCSAGIFLYERCKKTSHQGGGVAASAGAGAYLVAIKMAIPPAICPIAGAVLLTAARHIRIRFV